jgi:MFS family permease
MAWRHFAPASCTQPAAWRWRKAQKTGNGSLPFDGLTSLYVVSLMFGLSQGGIVPSYAIIVREYLPAAEAGRRIGFVIMATILGMALGGWMSGWIYDVTGSYQMAFLNGIAWNALNVLIVVMILLRTRRPGLRAVAA